MTDAELHIALREVVAIGRRGGYDNDEIAEHLARVVHDYAGDRLPGICHSSRRRTCLCPDPNPDCQHPTCPRYPQPGHLELS